MANASKDNIECEKAVKFNPDVPDGSMLKHHPTQKYNRKEVQKRLVVEAWMDDQLRSLYNCISEQESYPEIDLDDILRLKESYRHDFIEKSLIDAKHSTDAFIVELLSRIQEIKPLS
ncbi:Protein phosphatase 1 regulatory subunit 14B-like [Oopsacas minuta]|uniref:Protein phosphatase 1 regulatory subunit 14B-like n=1 Tax=Oopsacas minuta TaxID=111878 RepID=A0AAV7JET8_9METZ|nr:Protein phosphatase 1 regulatory subunit 14B-like [Oopsacas minuta]